MLDSNSRAAARRVVLSGGPCAGKTTIAEVISESFSEKVVVVPEAASMLFRGGFPRWPGPNAQYCLQRAVFRVQHELESIYMSQHPGSVFVFDRGTVDGAAYWPQGPDAFFEAMGSSHDAELSRYDRVIYLESAGADDYKMHQKNHPARTESWEQAKTLGERTRAIWSRHSNLTVVTCRPAFVDKVAEVVQIIQKELR